jgi:hypothetical protein
VFDAGNYGVVEVEAFASFNLSRVFHCPIAAGARVAPFLSVGNSNAIGRMCRQWTQELGAQSSKIGNGRQGRQFFFYRIL